MTYYMSRVTVPTISCYFFTLSFISTANSDRLFVWRTAFHILFKSVGIFGQRDGYFFMGSEVLSYFYVSKHVLF